MKKVVKQSVITAIALAVLCIAVILLTKDKMIVTVTCGNPFSDLLTDGWKSLPSGMEVELAPEGIVRVEAARGGKTYISLKVKALAPGECTAKLYIDGNESGYFWCKVSKGLFISENDLPFSGFIYIVFAVGLFLGLVCFFCIRYFLKIRGSELYSYNAIFMAGFALFSGLVAVNLLAAFVLHTVAPQHHTPYLVLNSLADSSGKIAWYLALPMFVFSAAMIVSNVELLKHERFRLSNVLGLIIPIGLILGIVIPFLINMRGFSGSFTAYRIRSVFENIYYTGYMYFECMLAGSIICAVRAVKRKVPYDKDFIIILGCRFRQDGSLTPLLKGRCDRATEFWKAQKEAGGKTATFIPSGGQGSDEPMPEAKAMADYLISCGIPKENIVLEDMSKNTYQNMEFSKKKIEERCKDAKVAYSTTNYHVFRSGLWASLAGLDADGIGAKTKWWFWPNAFMRECVGIMANRIREEAVLLTITVLISVLLTYFTIR